MQSRKYLKLGEPTDETVWRQEESVFNGLVSKGKKTVVAYGAAKFASGGKGEFAVSTSRAFKECSYRFLTIPVDEFRTTKMYNVLKAVQRRNTDATVRGLLWSYSTKDQSKL